MLTTCDGYSDLWDVFFDQLELTFPLSRGIKVYLNTESLSYSNDRFSIVVINNNEASSWSERFLKAIEQINEDFILLLTEEYIIEEVVNIERFFEAITLIERPNVASINLVTLPGNKIGDTYFALRELNYKNMISLQATLWKKNKLRGYIRLGESPWEFETLGSARGLFNDDKFYCVSDLHDNLFKYGMGLLIQRGYFNEEEFYRLSSLGISLNEKAREIKSIKTIRTLTSKNLMFIKLRFKKYLIIINRFIINRGKYSEN